VSVLFADLVGFTALSEARDVEEVRDLLTRYFDTCRRLVSRYGGTVEKFIGDAVMAVWGTPTAQEDDAERAVRTALELTAAVKALGQEVDAPALMARAGVVTGEAAVTLGAQGQGMVAGDLVNTASRIQAAALPGAVFVAESTKRATDPAIAYEEAGRHELKGKVDPVVLWRATRVVGGRGGALKATGLEPPFVGRDRELRMIKELFHRVSEEHKAHLVSVIGIAGIGKSRLSWEFFKYIDGLAGNVEWNRGRCLPYGEGVTYWALAEMVRMRAGIAEAEEQAPALEKLREAVRALMADAAERQWAEPRLAHLLGLEERPSHEREDLFAAWRLFFERLAQRGPTVMIFEDVQWADASMLDFIDYLLEWSTNHPLYVLTLARPELGDRRPTWGGARRNLTPLYLEPLQPDAMEELLVGFVPGLPPELRRQILNRAEGVPLYAVETVRMLLDRGLLVREEGRFATTEPVENLEVPETLHALIAARLDGLEPAERRLVQDASVLGKTFTKEALRALAGVEDEEMDVLLSSLIRKEVLTLQADPRSPERGQYGFLQDLTKRVAYDTLSKRERKSRHLAAAVHLEAAWGPEEDEIVEVVAAHFLEAYTCAPHASDADDIKRKSAEMLRRAGERAASLAANEEAQRYFERAAGLTEDVEGCALLRERAGAMAWSGGRLDASRRHFEEAIELFDSTGSVSGAARVSGRLGEVFWAEGRIEEAARRIERSIEVLRDEPDHDLAWLSAQLGRFLFFMGQPDAAARRIEEALSMAESLGLPDVLSEALNTKSLVLCDAWGRPEEGMALLRHSLVVATDHDVVSAAQRAYFNLSNVLYSMDQYAEAYRYCEEGLALATRMGEREWEWEFLANAVSVLYWTGRWDEALATASDIPRLEEIPAARLASVELLVSLPPLLVARGLTAEAREVLASFAAFEDSADDQERTSYAAARAVVFRAEGDASDALRVAGTLVSGASSPHLYFAGTKVAFVEAVEAALELEDWSGAERLLEYVRRLSAGMKSPYIRAQEIRLAARLDSARGPLPAAAGAMKEVIGRLREIEVPFWLAVALLEEGERLVDAGGAADGRSHLDEATDIFTRLGALPWLERTARVRSAAAGAALEALSGDVS
jgi:class 3 adenylate cyclase/tetratricopeptide (TPR) repeat protein